MITLKELSEYVLDAQGQIEDDFRATEQDSQPSIQLTVGVDSEGDYFGHQTGDNCFTGPTYGAPVWGVIGVYRDSDTQDLAEDLMSQIEDQLDTLGV